MKEKKIAAAKLSEIKNGEMKEVSLGETKVLLVRTADKCYAIGVILYTLVCVILYTLFCLIFFVIPADVCNNKIIANASII